jgi:AcrR family transcriptional regulator
MTLTSPRPLRIDAKRNYDLLVQAAEAELTEYGADASLEAIAKRAGVGIGTLYRHFPTRDDLIAKVLSASTFAIVALARELLDDPAPGDALARWIRELVEHNKAFRGLAATLANGFVAQSDNELCTSCETIANAGRALLERAQKAGEIRRDADVRELILTAHSAAWIAEQTQDPSAVDRLLGILFDGLRVVRRTPRPARKRSRR